MPSKFAHPIHGHCPRGKPSPTWISYVSAKARCQNSKRPKYKYYGARGVKFLFKSFQEFLAVAGPRPDGTSLDRWPNKYGNYEPGNIRWATRSEQNRNRRGTQAKFIRGLA